MKLFILRHAEAVDGADDFARALTRKGQDQSCAIGTFLAKANVQFDLAFTSPLVRARETAELVVAITNEKKRIKLQKTDYLLNETSTRDFAKWLETFKEEGRILLVGHNPSLTEHLARLLGVETAGVLNLSKGGLAAIKWLPPQMPELRLFITPKGTGHYKG